MGPPDRCREWLTQIGLQCKLNSSAPAGACHAAVRHRPFLAPAGADPRILTVLAKRRRPVGDGRWRCLPGLFPGRRPVADHPGAAHRADRHARAVDRWQAVACAPLLPAAGPGRGAGHAGRAQFPAILHRLHRAGKRAGGRQRADPAGPDGGAALGPARTRLPRGGGDAALGGVALAAYSPGVHRGRVPDVPGRAGLHRADLWVRAEHRRVPAGVHRADRRRLA
ncbi:hypothetical protein G6F57_013977 [Rhizopus arrhizus]|nr:hypothetical protein G6F68_009365 [Rhizopus microsporus]KAG1401095.1 hypothetical protein G6F59_013088 [Rhizopus arrhizus]KAG1462289.1 hypothetical protein G6F57_013977 [Rhizopus arrhizus]